VGAGHAIGAKRYARWLSRRAGKRFLCRLDYEANDQSKPLLVVIDGRSKPFRTELSAADYLAVRALGDEYLARNPRSIA
jgi:hypothetical protein